MRLLINQVHRLWAILVLSVCVPVWLFFYLLFNEPSTLLIVVSTILVPVLVGIAIGRMF